MKHSVSPTFVFEAKKCATRLRQLTPCIRRVSLGGKIVAIFLIFAMGVL